MIKTKKYVGGLLPIIKNVKNLINQKESLMNELSKEEIERMWNEMATIDSISLQLDRIIELLELSNEKSDLIYNKIGTGSGGDNNPDVPTIDPIEVSPEGALSNWNYVLDPTTQSVEINEYKTAATDENVAVYANYMQDGIRYKTKLGSNFKFTDNTNVKTISFSNNLDGSNITSMDSMFKGCTNLVSVTFGKVFKYANITSMSNMFDGCINIQNIDIENINTSNLINMSSMFANSNILNINEILKNIDTSKVTDMSKTFLRYKGRLDITDFNTSAVKNMNQMFYSCSNDIIGLENLDTSNVSDMSDMFNSCSSLTSLNLSSWNVSKVTNMRAMFNGCSNLTSLNINGWDISNCMNLGLLFRFCSKLTEILVSRDKWVISEGCDTSLMFNGCGCSEVTYVD